ncbi:MAG: AtpZ/AtpI family protein, partial [Lachnospiraceae bacterium]|nr:AtpZ/AtpI family protein [Lachnospiraceae bacterium]
MISQFTIHMLVPICMCSYVGYLLDKKWNTDLMFILFFFIGA